VANLKMLDLSQILGVRFRYWEERQFHYLWTRNT